MQEGKTTYLEDRESRPFCIPIVGGRSVGKTAYITAFSREFLENVAPKNGLEIEFYNENLSFDKIDKLMGVLSDFCVTKGENLSQYADMDEFMRNFVLVIMAILVLIVIVSRLNKNNKSLNNTKPDTVVINKTSNDNELVAILTAAIAAYEHKSADGIRIKTIRKNIRWKNI